ncbi:MAG: hypothetical protein RBR42_04910 [Desulfomicrobium sp.]|nr:hypothetical protein [Desulfomicrobium sp.]
MKEKEPITLSALYGGAVVEAVDHEISNALSNIMDVNTSPTQARTVTLKLKIKPNKERNIASVAFQASSTLAPAEALETSIIIDRDESGRPTAFELSPGGPQEASILPFFGTGEQE